jgi:Tol biopolymer transport system component
MTALFAGNRLASLGLAAALAAAALLSGGCHKPPPKPKGTGRSLAATAARRATVSPDSRAVAFVSEVAPPPEREAPDGVFQGVLVTMPLAGGAPRQLGGGVTTLEDGYRFSPDGKWIAYLQGFRFRDQSGNLNLAAMPLGDPRPIAESARYYKFSPDGRFLGFVAQGEMRLLDLSGTSSRKVTSDASTFEFSEDSKWLLVRRPSAAGGSLLLAEVEPPSVPKKLADNVGEYEFSPDATLMAFTSRVGGPADPYSLFVGSVQGTPRKVADNVSTFLFSPDNKYLAFIGGMGMKKALGNLVVAPAAGGPPIQIGENVVEYRWAPSSQAIGLRESHEDKSGRTWESFRVATMPSGTTRHTENGVPNFVWSSDGAFVAFLKRVTKPSYSVDLYLLDVAGEAGPRVVEAGVFGYQFAPGDHQIWYRTHCVRNGRECDLMSASVSDAAVLPVRLVQSIWNFKPSADGERLLVTYPRLDTEEAADLGWMDLKAKQPSRGIDIYTLPGAVFVGETASQVVYLVSERKREGVYIADLK